MNIEILYQPAHALAHLSLSSGETVTAESGAMVAMTPNIQIQTGAGGILKGIKRLFGGESFFRNTFTANGPADLYLAPALCGDMTILDSGSDDWFIQSTSYVASSSGVDVETKVGGFRSFFAGEGIFVMKTRGQGKVLVSAFGGLERVDVNGAYVIDTGHLVAWTGRLDYSVGKSTEGWISSFLSGEGLACHFRGQGTVWIQSRNPAAYGGALGRLLPPRRE